MFQFSLYPYLLYVLVLADIGLLSVLVLADVGLLYVLVLADVGLLYVLVLADVDLLYVLVLADVGGLFAEGVELAWDKNKDRVTRLAEKLKIIAKR